MSLVDFSSGHLHSGSGEFDIWIQPLVGGILVGVSTALLLGGLGRVAGISGILGGLLPLPKVNAALEIGWRAAFLLGLVVVGILGLAVGTSHLTSTAPRSTSQLVVAGLLVGFGTRLGSGCTSGHGVCGISRGAIRSIVATLTFITTGAFTVAIMRAFSEAS